jgi:DMSO/TMAO reductase YedYZ molybdopterin-dependent catalytic subunit
MALLVATVAVSWHPSLTRADRPPLAIDGLVKQAQHVTADDLRRLPPVERRVTFQTDHGDQTATYKGVLLWTLVARAGINDPAKWSDLRHVVAVTAADGYLLMVSLGEIDPNFGNAPVLLAYEQDGKPLSALRLIFPGDKHGARDVREVVRIEVR